MQPFLFNTTHSILQEPGGVRRLGSLCQERGARRVLIVTDAGIHRLGLLNNALDSLSQAGVATEIFQGVEADPSDRTVLRAAEMAKGDQTDLVIGFGGGSSMDVAKLVALLASPTCRQSLNQIYGVDQARGQRLPLILVPTTAGTGSEVTPIAIVTTGETTKAGVVSPVLLPDLALLDAELTLGLPPHVTAATGIDAMVHAIEAYTSKLKKNPVSDMLAKEALRLLSGNILKAVQHGEDLEARSNMLLGATLAGQAFANAPVAAVHALAYPLGGHFHIPHGLSNSLVLPHVLEFNGEMAAPLYGELAPIILGERCTETSDQGKTRQLIQGLQELIAALDLPSRLRDLDIPEDSLDTLAQDAMLQQRLLVNNPRAVSEQDALAIYQAAY